MGDGSTGSYRWQGQYPALSPEEAKDLSMRIDAFQGKIKTLQDALDAANERAHNLEKRNEELEGELNEANRAKEGYLQALNSGPTFETPKPNSDWIEPFSS